MAGKNDFSKGSIAKNILSLALPMTVAQLINVLYSVVDRIYIGHIPDASTLALTGLGITFPIISIISAFTNLFGMGGAPLCSIARGRGDDEEAENIMGNAFTLLVISGLLLTVVCLYFRRPLLYAFGASDDTFPYADGYLTIYLLGSLFVTIGLGMNNFINSQGFGRIGMMTVMLGAVTNILLDPLLIFGFHMGVQGAALATILSQFLSAFWVLRFLTGSTAIYRLRPATMRLQPAIVKRIVTLGFSNFIMALTNSTVQVACNATLQRYGGDLYVGIMTVLNSLREMVMMPAKGLTDGAQPVLGFNYGAQEYGRVRKGIKFMSFTCIAYTTFAWLCIFLFPEVFIRLFNSDPLLIERGVPAMHIYFFGIFMMSLQMSAQATYLALGKSKQAIFFSIFRKIIIVTPLTLLLPMVFGLGTNGVFLAEPISNFIGGIASFGTMMLTIWPMLRSHEEERA